MASDREKRFRNLERPRPVEPDAAPSGAAARFGRVEPSGRPPGDAPVPEAAVDRFRDPKERPLEVAQAREGEQPFARCAACEMDNSVYAATCQNCGSDLTTPEQQAFNERLWARRREEAAAEAAAHADLERERERIAAEEARARRDLATAMARQEARRVDDRLDEATWGQGGWGRRGWGGPAGGGWDDEGFGGGGTSYGLRWLRRIKNPLARLGVIAGAIALPVLLIALPARQSGWRVAGMLVAVVLVALVSPPGWRIRRRGWWGW